MSFQMNNWPLVKLGKILTESKIEATDSDADNRIRVLLNANGVIKRPLTKETEGATKYFERYFTLSDSLDEVSSRNVISNLEAKFNKSENEKKIIIYQYARKNQSISSLGWQT